MLTKQVFTWVMVASLLGGMQTRAAQVTSTWVGGTGNWNNASNWSPAVVPNNGVPANTTYAVRIDNGSAATSNVTLDVNSTVDSLAISSGDTLGISNGQTFTLANAGTLSNAGTILLLSSGSNTRLRIGGDTTLNGGGVIAMSSNINNAIFGLNTGNERLTNVDNTISGGGNLGGNAMRLTNQGTIRSNTLAGLTVDVVLSGSLNSGTMEAVLNSTLTINPGSIDNTGGTVEANIGTVTLNGTAFLTGGTVAVQSTSQIKLVNGASITGGTLTNSSTGIIQIQGGTNTIGGAVTNPAGGSVTLDNGASLVLNGGPSNTYSNSGSILLNSTGSSTDLRINGDVTLGGDGNGNVLLTGNVNNRIIGNTGGDHLINTNNLISGSGALGGNTLRLTNNSVISNSSTVALTVDVSGTSSVNTGYIVAGAGGAITFNSGTFNNSGGTIRAHNGTTRLSGTAVFTGGTVDVSEAGLLQLANGASVTGGTLSNSSTGIIQSQGGTNTIGGTVSNPAGGQIILDNGTTLVFSGGAGNSYSNAGSIAMNSTGSSTDIRINGEVTLSGNGNVMLSGNANNRIIGNTGSDHFINASNTIAGSGALGANSLRVTNQATISNSVAPGLVIDVSGTDSVNTGLILSNGGTLTINTGNINNTAGTVRANVGIVKLSGTANLTGGTVEIVGAGLLQLQNGASITGGTLSNSTTGTIQIQGGTNTIGGVVSNPLGGSLTLDNGAALVLNGGAGNSYSNAGSLALNSTGSSTDLRINGGVTLGGGGIVNLTNNVNNRIFGNTGSDQFINANNTIRGTGVLGNNSLQFTNQGSLLARAGETLTVNVTPNATGFSNAGTVQTETGGTIAMSNGDIFTQTAGQTIVNGTLTLSGPTTLALQGGTLSGSGTISGAVNNSGGSVIPGNSPGTLNLAGNYTQASGGTYQFELTGLGHDQINVTGTVTLGGAILGLMGPGFFPAVGDSFVVINNDGTDAVSGTFAGLPQGATVSLNGMSFQISYTGGSGNDVMLTRLPPSLGINDVTVTEGNSGSLNAVFTLTLTELTGQVTVDVATANGTSNPATAGVDYTAMPVVTVTIPAGQLTQTVSIAVLGDTLDENNEIFFVDLTNINGATLADAQGLGTITDNDSPPTVSINDVTVTEGNTGTLNANFIVSLSAASGKTVSVQLASANGTAVAPGDYSAVASTTLTFAPGETTKTITVPVVGDTTDEVDETFVVNLTNPTNATIADAQGLGTITDNDIASALTIGDLTFTEGSTDTVTNTTFTVTLTPASGKTVTVNYTTADSTAKQPGDYNSRTGTLTFSPGQTSKTIAVGVKGDLIDEDNETFRINLSGVSGATIGDSQGVCTITDDDSSTISINDVTIVENDSGPKNLKFTVSLSNPSAKTVTVDFGTADGTATAGNDYVQTSGTVTFSIGQTVKTFIVPSTGDLLDELNETIFANLSNPTNATITDNQGVGTINDNDLSPTLTINDITKVEGNSGSSNAVFTVTLSAISGRAVTVNFTTVNGTASSATDYTTTTGTLTIPAGQLTGTINVPVSGDTTVEPAETFKVNLSGASGANIGDTQGICTISNDDVATLQAPFEDEPSE